MALCSFSRFACHPSARTWWVHSKVKRRASSIWKYLKRNALRLLIEFIIRILCYYIPSILWWCSGRQANLHPQSLIDFEKHLSQMMTIAWARTIKLERLPIDIHNIEVRGRIIKPKWPNAGLISKSVFINKWRKARFDFISVTQL